MRKIYIDELFQDVYEVIENVISYPIYYYMILQRFSNQLTIKKGEH